MLGALEQQENPPMAMLSTYHPGKETLLSLPQTHLICTSCPTAFVGRLIMVVTKPPEFPLQACRPPSKLPYELLMVWVYPPVTKLPPAARISMKSALPILISSTAPS